MLLISEIYKDNYHLLIKLEKETKAIEDFKFMERLLNKFFEYFRNKQSNDFCIYFF